MISKCQAIHREFPEKEIETPHRRGFLLGTSAAVAALVLPQASLADGGSKAFMMNTAIESLQHLLAGRPSSQKESRADAG